MPLTRNEHLYPIVNTTSVYAPLVQVVYVQDGQPGSPRGLLVSLTSSGKIQMKGLVTPYGVQQITS